MGCGASTPAHRPPEEPAPLPKPSEMQHLESTAGEVPRTTTAMYAEAASFYPDKKESFGDPGSASETRSTTAMYADAAASMIPEEKEELGEQEAPRTTTAMYAAAGSS